MIPDRIGVEVALSGLGVSISEASYLGGETRWHSEETGQTFTDHALHWMRMDGAQVLSDAAMPTRSVQCTTIEGRDPVPGDRTLHLYRSTPTETEEAMAIALGAQPGVILASTEDGEVALATLRPGDQITMVQAEHTRSGARAERLELRRENRRLVLERSGGAPEACYGPVPEADL